VRSITQRRAGYFFSAETSTGSAPRFLCPFGTPAWFEIPGRQ
jgi:hypothetical protein